VKHPVVYHKSWRTSEPGLLLDGAVDDSSESSMTCDIGRVLTLVNLGRFAVSMLPVTDDSMKSHPWHLWSALRLSMLPVTDDSMKSHPWPLLSG